MICLVDAGQVAAVENRLRESDATVDRWRRNGGLSIVALPDVSTSDNRFDPDAARRWVEGQLDRALAAKRRGLRLFVDAPQTLSGAAPQARLEWEVRLGELAAARPLVVLCVAESRRLAPTEALAALAAHDAVWSPAGEPPPEARAKAMRALALRSAECAGALLTAERALATLDALPHIAVMFGPDHQVLVVNQAAARIAQWLAGRTIVPGESIDEIVPTPQAERFERHAARAFDGELVWSTGELVGLDGRRRSFEICYAPVLDSEGVARGVCLVALDVTNRRIDERETARLDRQIRAQERIETVERLAGGIALELNNLLHGIRGSAEMVLQALPAAEPLTVDVAEIRDAAAGASRLTQQLLLFSRHYAGKPVIADLNELLGENLPAIRQTIGQGVEVIFAPRPELPPFRVDPSQFEQLLRCLATNARDAMPHGGRFVIETAQALLDEEYCRFHPGVAPGPFVMFSVSDTGVGISEDAKAHLFEPFFSTKGRGAGAGLGLAVVHGIVTRHRGHLYVYSERDLGATFKLYFPVSSRTETSAESPAVVAAPGGSETVLLAEDEPSVRALAEKILWRQGYRVLSAGHGEEALALATGLLAPIHLLVTDVVMPNMNGRQLYDRLRASGRRDLRVLYMSGYPESVVARMGVLHPGALFLSKPFTAESLARKTREALDKP